MSVIHRVVLLVSLFECLLPSAARAQVDRDVAVALRAAVPASERGYLVDAAGLSRSGLRLTSLEPMQPPAPAVRRLVIIGGLDGRAASQRAVTDFVTWWFHDPASVTLRSAWQVAVIPCALPERCGGAGAPAGAATMAFPPADGFFDAKTDPESRFVWRWAAMQGPDLVIDVRTGGGPSWRANALAQSRVSGASPADASSLAGALGTGTPSGLAPVAALELTTGGALAAVLRPMLARVPGVEVSPLRRAIEARVAKSPLDVARSLAGRYPEAPSMSYIPALSWAGAMRLAEITSETKWRDKPLREMQPFLDGAKPAIAEPYLLTSLAGHLAFSDMGARDGNDAAALLAKKAADFMMPALDTEIVRFARAWTDDMFMATSVLSRVSARAGDDRYAPVIGRLLTTYAARQQRGDGLFIHAAEGPHTWGRGNGFAAFGLTDALTYLPATWPDRARVLLIYQRLMEGLRQHQAADGRWREVVDEPGSYRELTVTAMTITAMARGIRMGWLDASYRPVVDRAWRGLQAMVASDGSLLDVCTGTGAGALRPYYLERPATSGAEDRGGAMTITAALEMYELQRPSR